MKILPFYISSLGHPATVWLVADFSKHPEIVCCHKTRTVPPKSRGAVTGMSPEQFIDVLRLCSESNYGQWHGFNT